MGAPHVSSEFPIYRGRRQRLSVPDILREISAAAELPLEQATTLPAEAYTSDAYFEWEVDNLVRREWMCVAHISQLPGIGDFINLDMIGEPLIVIRGKDGVVRTLSRVCPHRGMDIMPPGYGEPGSGPADRRASGTACGHTRILMCPYHAWTFELDGELKGTPEMHKAEGFSREDHGLRAWRTETWHGFIFVNFDGNAQPLAEQFSEMSEAVAGWTGLEEMEVIIERAWDCEFNWKVLFENFSECYHHIGAHSKTLQPLMPAKECWTEQEKRNFIFEHLPLKQSVADELNEAIAAGTQFPLREGMDHQRLHEWQIVLAPPCFMLFAGPNQIAWYRLDPLTTDRCRLLTTILVPKGARDLPQFEACHATALQALIDFHSEDMDICAALQRGLYGSGFQRGRMCHLEMPIWLFHRFLAARARGTWPTVDRPPAPGQNGRVGPVPA